MAAVFGLLSALKAWFAVADVVRVLGAPARALFHHRIANEIALDETAGVICPCGQPNFFWTPARRIWIDNGAINTGA